MDGSAALLPGVGLQAESTPAEEMAAMSTRVFKVFMP
jgi:hypothetical protein